MQFSLRSVWGGLGMLSTHGICITTTRYGNDGHTHAPTTPAAAARAATAADNDSSDDDEEGLSRLASRPPVAPAPACNACVKLP